MRFVSRTMDQRPSMTSQATIAALRRAVRALETHPEFTSHNGDPVYQALQALKVLWIGGIISGTAYTDAANLIKAKKAQITEPVTGAQLITLILQEEGF